MPTILKISKEDCEEIEGKWTVEGCEVEGEVHPKIKEFVEEHGIDGLKTALFEGSIGYYTPASSRPLLKHYFRGNKKCYSERCMSCFDDDAEKMLLHDIEYFEWLLRRNPDKAMSLKKYVKELEKLDEISQETAGLLYPTIG